MAIVISKETQVRTRQLPFIVNEDDFTEIFSIDVDDIAPGSYRQLPVAIWFLHDRMLYEFLTPTAYTTKNHEALLKLAHRHDAFKLFVQTTEHATFLQFVEECRSGVISLMPTPKQAIAEIKNKAEQIFLSLSVDHLSPAAAHAGREIVTEVINAVLVQPKMLSLLTQLLTMDGKILDHAIAVSVVSAALGKQLGFRSTELSKIALGGLLHDIGNLKLPSHLIGSDKDPTGDELELLKTHTMHGQQMLDRLSTGGVKIATEVEIILLQHHERFNGFGYPNRKRGRQEEEGSNGIYYYARIVAVADTYVDFLEEAHDSDVTQAETLARMFKQDGSFDPLILTRLTSIIKKELTA